MLYMEIFRYLTPFFYTLLALIWVVAFVFFCTKIFVYRSSDKLLTTLLIILSVTSFGLFFDSLFFGITLLSKLDFLPIEFYDRMYKPEFIIIPKSISLTAGICVVFILITKWFPSEINRAKEFQDVIDDKTIELQEMIYDLEEAKRNSEDSNKLKMEFLENLSHEIRTPMNGIIGFSRMLNSPNLSVEKQKKYTEVIIESCNQLGLIIDDILEMSILRSSNKIVRKADVCIKELIDELVLEYDDKVKKGNLQLLCENQTNNDTVIYNDRNKIKKILIVILDNAIRHTLTGVVKIIVKKENDYLFISVSDTGKGIPAELLDLIFNPFFQVKDNSKNLQRGLGLGLSIAKEYSNLINGEIIVVSKINEGSVFTLKLPLV